jgi:DNA-binding response OmpR family regulator
VRLLLVEDYAPLARSLRQGLSEAGYAVDHAADGAAAVAYLEGVRYDVVVLDVVLPKIDGLAVLDQLRGRKDTTPVLLLTSRDTVSDRVAGLDRGADDYLVKPFELAELLARLRALVRRGYRAADNVLRIADLEIDIAAKKVIRAGRPISLSAREFSLLEYLAVRRGQIVSRTDIVEHVYDFAAEPGSNVIDVYIGYLRRKIDDPCERKLIHTRRGQGYVLEEES